MFKDNLEARMALATLNAMRVLKVQLENSCYYKVWSWLRFVAGGNSEIGKREDYL